MEGVILPNFCYLESHTPWRSPEFLAKEQAIRDAETKARRIAGARQWELELRQRLKNSHGNLRDSGEDHAKLRSLIKDAIWCQGPMEAFPRRPLDRWRGE